MSQMCVFDNQLCFEVAGDLEKYRVESIFEKEPETIAWIDDCVKKSQNTGAGKSVFFDIGANIGIYTLYAAHQLQSLSVYAFEPVSNNFNALQKNIWANDYKNVYPFNLALAEKNGLVSLFLSDLRVGNSGAQIRQPVNELGQAYESLREEKILSCSLDSLIQDNGFPVPSFIKIDVDGHETDILNGMLQTLSNNTLQSMLIEFNNNKEFTYWQSRLLNLGLVVDHSFDQVPNHSGIRRQNKGAAARNYTFKRI